MSVSTLSRSPSLFSLASAASSCTSAPPSPITSVTTEKLAPGPTPLVLQWKPQLFATGFSSTQSSHLHFTAFPPQNVPKSTFERLSFDTAVATLHHNGDPRFLNPFATAHSKVTPVCDVVIPSNLPVELIMLLRNDEWDYYTINDTVSLPIGIGGVASTQKHQAAIRKLQNGIERYIFGPGGLSIHSICQVRDMGTRCIEDIPRERLYLEERTEVLCNKALKWWYESQLSKRMAEIHECLRLRWDERFRARWEQSRSNEKADLLA